MSRVFRYAPPEPRPGLVVRPRLLRSLAGRWQHRVTALTGGPGLGKTTVLAQAIAENHLAPRGEDLWVGLEPHDADADSLARVVAAAIARRGDGDGGDDSDGGLHDAARGHQPADPRSVADAVWHRAPTQECLVLDDVHLLDRGSSGAEWLEALLAALPANGHVVLAGRTDPPVKLGRYGSQGEVLRLAEDDLRFDDEELSGFARLRGIDPTWLDVTGGWPAMAELVATVDQRLTGTYLWEEVLEPLGTVRRHVLAVLCDFGGGDDALISAAVGTPVELAEALHGVPLLARRADGWYVPHGLWRTAPGLTIEPGERMAVRRRAVDELLTRHRYDDAFGLVEEAELWDLAPRVLRAACLAPDRLVSSQLGRWLTRLPDGVKDTMAGRLATGIHLWLRDPGRAIEPLREAARRARDVGDVDAEVTVLAQLGNEAWWRRDLTALARTGARVTTLAETGNPRALQLAAVGRIVAADVMGDDQQVLAEMDRLDPADADPAWLVLAIWLSGGARWSQGDLDGMLRVADQFGRTTDPQQRYVLTALQSLVGWLRGDVDGAVASIDPIMRAAHKTGNMPYVHFALTLASVVYAAVGAEADARRCYEDACRLVPQTEESLSSAQLLLALAMLRLAEGDEAAAVAALRETTERHGLDRGVTRHYWRMMLAVTYALVPESRTHWDGLDLQGPQWTARQLARAIVASREGRAGRPGSPVRTVTLPPAGVVRALLGHHMTAELAIGLAEVGRPEGRTLLLSAGPAAREVVRIRATGGSLADGTPVSARRAKAARLLLAATPAPPPRKTVVGVLGTLVVRRDGWDGDEVVDPDLRRRRVQELLAYLVGHRHTTRPAIAGALWPELGERAAGNNLGVTLSHLLRVLEPWRDQGEPSYLLRVDGSVVQLVTDGYLRLDVDEFDTHLAAAAQAEADGAPSLALEHDLAAVALYRDMLHLDVAGESSWLDLDREHYKSRFVAAAVRSGQLLLARGDVEKSQAIVYRALTTDPWSEDAYAVLVGAALARGDRSGARRLLQRCEGALAELGVEPSEAVRQLRRRIELAE